MRSGKDLGQEGLVAPGPCPCKHSWLGTGHPEVLKEGECESVYLVCLRSHLTGKATERNGRVASHVSTGSPKNLSHVASGNLVIQWVQAAFLEETSNKAYFER